MKNTLLSLTLMLAFLGSYGQLYNSGGNIFVQSGAILVIEGDYTSTSSGNIDIDGTVELKGNFVNNSGTIDATSTGTLKFVGPALQAISGSVITDFICNVEIDNGGFGVEITGADQVISAALLLTNGKLTLNAYDLTLGAVATVTADATSYIVTNGAGQLKRPVAVADNDVAFPVGTATSYNPLVLNNDGTADTYGVSFDGAMPSGWTGSDHAVTGHWTVTEDVADGSDLTVTTQWNGGQQQTNFDNTDCAVGVSADLGATVDWAASGAAVGTDPYTKDGAGFTDVGTFLVGDAFYLFINLDLDVLLAGPYNSSLLSMGLGLNTNSMIPGTDPYGLGTSAASIPANAVDWIKVEFRDKVDTTVSYSRAYFIDPSGNVIGTDGVLGAKVQGVPKDQYFIAVRHRNHLGAMTNSPVDLTASSPSFNFIAGTGVFGTNPMKMVGTNTYALWAGDANADGTVIYGNSPSDITPVNNAVTSDPNNTNFDPSWGLGTAVYHNADTDMNGFVYYGFSPSDVTPINATVTGHPSNPSADPTVLIHQQLPN